MISQPLTHQLYHVVLLGLQPQPHQLHHVVLLGLQRRPNFREVLLQLRLYLIWRWDRVLIK